MVIAVRGENRRRDQYQRDRGTSVEVASRPDGPRRRDTGMCFAIARIHLRSVEALAARSKH